MGLERQLWEPFVRAEVGESPPSIKNVVGKLSGPFAGNQENVPAGRSPRFLGMLSWDVFS